MVCLYSSAAQCRELKANHDASHGNFTALIYEVRIYIIMVLYYYLVFELCFEDIYILVGIA